MSLADVTSANVVGYNSAGVRTGAKVIGLSFDQIALSEGGMKISQIFVTGYEDVNYFKKAGQKGIKENKFELSILNAVGGVATYADGPLAGKKKKWCFRRTYDRDNSVWKDDARWTLESDETTIITGDLDYTIERGEGLYFNVDDSCYDDGNVPANKYSLQNAGQAILDSNAVLINTGAKCVAIPLSAPVKLSQIRPIGYEDVNYFKKAGQKGVKSDKFTISVLNAVAGVETYKDGPRKGKQMKWCFRRTYDRDNSVWKNDGRWVFQDDGETVITEETDVQFNIGDALYVNVDDSCYDEGSVSPDKYSLEFPGIDDTYASEK